MKSFKCKICGYRVNKETYGKHLEKKHSSIVNDSGLTSEHLAFVLRTGKEKSICVANNCGAEVAFNEKTKKYNRFCENPRCKKDYRETFLKRMRKVYKKDHLLDDIRHQEKMLGNRRISGSYKFQDGAVFNYVGSYEKDFLEFLDLELNWPSEDIVDAEDKYVFYYKNNGSLSGYIPDKIILSLGPLIIEVKSTENKHYRLRELDSGMEEAKEEAVRKAGYAFLKVADKKYDDFVQYVEDYKRGKI